MRNWADTVCDGDLGGGDEGRNLALCSEKFGKLEKYKVRDIPHFVWFRVIEVVLT